MAITRAIGRVYAQNFRWIIKLAGYETTPAEEMPEYVPEIKEPKPSRTATEPYDPQNDRHKKRLAEELKRLSVPNEAWSDISLVMGGQTLDALQGVIDDYWKEKGNDGAETAAQ